MPALPKKELRELISQGQTDQALAHLLEWLAVAPALRKSYNELISLRGQLSTASANFKLGLIEFPEARREFVRVDIAVQAHLDQLPDEIVPSKSKAAASETALRQSIEAVTLDADWEYDLFFSFSSHDLDAARDFCNALRGYGLRVFFSADDLRLRAGHSFGDVIEKALERSRHFLLFCSPQAMQSKWVKLERETFFQQYHLRDEEIRGFYIAEGPGFAQELVPAFYRRYQRLQSSEDLLHSLVGVGSREASPRASSVGSREALPRAASMGLREASPRAAANENPGLSVTTGSTEPSPRPTAADGHAWEFTTDAGTRAAYEKYLARFPQGFYVTEAHARLDALHADDTAWEFASDAGTETALQKYLQKYPEGLHVAEAREQLSVFYLERRAEEDRKATAERRNIDPFHDLMVPIKGGTFDMGDTFGDGGDDEKPVHKVTLSDFYLCKYPVTQGQWKAVMGNNPSHFTDNDMLPVENVSWDDAREFIKKLNEKTGLKYRLPTEAEWEYAAREGGKKVRFGNGKDIADPREMNFNASKEYKNAYSVVGEYRAKTTPVDQFKPNALGLHDMSGNVWEWCEDWYGSYSSEAQTNPMGPKTGKYRCVLGGSWSTSPSFCRASVRSVRYPHVTSYGIGFRVVRH